MVIKSTYKVGALWFRKLYTKNNDFAMINLDNKIIEIVN